LADYHTDLLLSVKTARRCKGFPDAASIAKSTGDLPLTYMRSNLYPWVDWLISTTIRRHDRQSAAHLQYWLYPAMHTIEQIMWSSHILLTASLC
jgi:hypothetical protein